MKKSTRTTKKAERNEQPLSKPGTMAVWPDAAERLGIGKNAAYAAAKNGEIPVIRIGGRVLVITAALERMLQGGRPASA